MFINAGITIGNTKSHIKTNLHNHESCGIDICKNYAEVIVRVFVLIHFTSVGNNYEVIRYINLVSFYFCF